MPLKPELGGFCEIFGLRILHTGWRRLRYVADTLASQTARPIHTDEAGPTGSTRPSIKRDQQVHVTRWSRSLVPGQRAEDGFREDGHQELVHQLTHSTCKQFIPADNPRSVSRFLLDKQFGDLDIPSRDLHSYFTLWLYQPQSDPLHILLHVIRNNDGFEVANEGDEESEDLSRGKVAAFTLCKGNQQPLR